MSSDFLSKGKLQGMRERYEWGLLDSKDLADCPITQFQKWFAEIQATGQVAEPNAMTLATADDDGVPSARTVLLKGGLEHSAFWFFTNHTSRKGQDLAVNPHAALVFLWKECERQVCVRGLVTRLSREDSENYFQSRPYESQIGAWASRQSSIVENRAQLEAREAQLHERFPKDTAPIPCPDFWGGYSLTPLAVEFWQGRPGRLHDRFSYERETPRDSWACNRLAP